MTSRELAERTCVTLRGRGHQAYFVGGCVRDLELGRHPADYDVCTDARPEQVQELFPRSLAVGAKFGVILVLEDEAPKVDVQRNKGAEVVPEVTADTLAGIAVENAAQQNRTQVEVATFRSDAGYSDGRHPDQVIIRRRRRKMLSGAISRSTDC